MNSSASVPLSEALPWLTPSDTSKCWLVCDSVETDGRFLLHTVATQTLKLDQNVYWVACGPWTCRLIAAAMKKLGCEAAALYLRDSSSSCPLHIQSVTVDISTKLANDDTENEFDTEVYMKELFQSIRTWTLQQSDGGLVVIDDASALASLVGERLTYCFLLSLRALTKRANCNILIRCSQDYDMDVLKEQDTSSVRAGGSRNIDWVGAGGAIKDSSVRIPWERNLAELADSIVNVEPLASGYSREAHGRLVFVEHSQAQSLTPIVMNYCCQDTSVSAIRLRGSSSK